MNVERPIFITGVGRSGSTMFHELVSFHPETAWLSGLNDRFPDRPEINRAYLQSVDLPVVGDRARTAITPGEAFVFWEHHCRGFRRPCRDLVADDLTESSRRTMPAMLGRNLTPRRHRLAHKLTGWPRIGYLHAMFPDAKFVHIARDGRAVANSMLHVEFWWGWRGPENWRWGMLSPELQQEWEAHGKSFAALAAIEWKLMMQAHEAAVARVPAGSVLDIRYEEICEDPVGHIRDIIAFCDLPWNDDFERRVGRANIRNTNDKWRRDLNARQQADIESVLADALPRYGYST